MWEEVVKLAVSNGLFAVLFVGLLLYILRDSKARETKYQCTIEKLSNHLGIIEDIDQNVKAIKKVVFKVEGETKDAEKTERKS